MFSRVSLTSWEEEAYLGLVGHPSSECATIPCMVDVLLYLLPLLPIFIRLKLNHWSVETDSTRQILVVGVINVHAYPSWIVFSGCIIPPDNKETKLGSINQEPSPSTGKNTGVVLMPCHIWKHGPSRTFVGVIISEVPGCYLLQQISSQLGLQKLL